MVLALDSCYKSNFFQLIQGSEALLQKCMPGSASVREVFGGIPEQGNSAARNRTRPFWWFWFCTCCLEQLPEKTADLLFYNIHRVDNSINEDFLAIN